MFPNFVRNLDEPEKEMAALVISSVLLVVSIASGSFFLFQVTITLLFATVVWVLAEATSTGDTFTPNYKKDIFKER